jgi:hypothetical protein
MDGSSRCEFCMPTRLNPWTMLGEFVSKNFLKEQIYVDWFEGPHYYAGRGGKFRLFEGRFQ